MNVAFVVVPRWFLVWYNIGAIDKPLWDVVVPRWFLVWYNTLNVMDLLYQVVVPRWFLVWYNRPLQKALEAWLQGLFGIEKK